jgi:hypothetical protein
MRPGLGRRGASRRTWDGGESLLIRSRSRRLTTALPVVQELVSFPDPGSKTVAIVRRR